MKDSKFTDKDIKDMFDMFYPSDGALVTLAEKNREFMLESIAARHRYTAFLNGARMMEAMVASLDHEPENEPYVSMFAKPVSKELNDAIESALGIDKK